MKKALTKHLMTTGMAKKRGYFGQQHNSSCETAFCCSVQTTNTNAAKQSILQTLYRHFVFPRRAIYDGLGEG